MQVNGVMAGRSIFFAFPCLGSKPILDFYEFDG